MDNSEKRHCRLAISAILSGLFRNIEVGVRQVARAGKVRRVIKISKVSLF